MCMATTSKSPNDGAAAFNIVARTIESTPPESDIATDLGLPSAPGSVFTSCSISLRRRKDSTVRYTGWDGMDRRTSGWGSNS